MEKQSAAWGGAGRLIRSLVVVFVVCVAAMLSAQADASQPPWATGDSRPEDLRVSLVTFGPGDRIVEWFGHTALVVEDARLGRARLYNYGMFSFDAAMLVKFAMGRLWFWAGQSRVEPTYRFYEQLGRDVRILELNLPAKTRLEVAQTLASDVLPENREYLYHHYANNCSTRIRDIIDQAVSGELEAVSTLDSPRSLRDLTRIHSQHSPVMEMVLMFLMNDSIDQPIRHWDEMFLPGRLEQWVREVAWENEQGERVSLVAKEHVYFDAARPALPSEPPTRWPWTLLAGLLVGVGVLAAGIWRARAAQRRAARLAHGLAHAGVGLLIGLPGLLLFAMASFTDHEVTKFNENLFLANPMTAMILPLGVAYAFGAARAQRWLAPVWTVCGSVALALVPLKLLPGFDQNNWMVIALLLPMVVLSALGARIAAASVSHDETSTHAEDLRPPG